MPFLEKTDFPANVHDDILDALTRGNDDIVTENASRTVDEMKAYMNGRYDTTVIFNAVGDQRNKFLLRLATTITLYNIYLVHNPRKLHQVFIDTYDKAIETLEKIQKGIVNPEGLPLPPNETDANSGTGQPVQWGSSDALGSDW